MSFFGMRQVTRDSPEISQSLISERVVELLRLKEALVVDIFDTAWALFEKSPNEKKNEKKK